MHASIELSKKQYERLLKLVYLGNWVVNAHRTDDRKKEYDDVEGLVFSHARTFGFPQFLDDEHEIGGRRHFPTQEFELNTDIHEFQEQYDNDTFWDELLDRLAERDVDSEFGDRAATSEQRLAALYEREQQYADEVEKYGLERLKIAHEVPAEDSGQSNS